MAPAQQPVDLDSPAAEQAHELAVARKDILRIATAGSVDDGKSTLIGRLLYDSKAVFEDQYEAVERASKGDYVDLALLTDGLRAEREQGITIDVAYRYFSPPRPPAVPPQHGPRCLDRRPRDRAGRRPQGDAGAEQAARLPRLAAAGAARG